MDVPRRDPRPGSNHARRDDEPAADGKAAADVKPPAKARSFLESFGQGDAKLLMVTFVGTVAANVVTVMVVALAVIYVRARTAAQHNHASSAFQWTGYALGGGQQWFP